MIFIGEPGLLVVDRRGKKKYRFDENGELEIADPLTIKKFSTRFKAQEFVCKHCGKVCKNALGLSSHERSHERVKDEAPRLQKEDTETN